MSDLLSTRDRPRRAPQLQADDWVSAALATLVEDGIEAVQITVLAKRLGVTRGSFYWHFTNREALLSALLDEWRARNSGVMLDAMAEAPTIEAGVLELFAVWVDHTRFDPALDQAVRDWARRDAALHQVVSAEDDARVAAIAAFFRRMAMDRTEAFIRARVIYFTQLSYYALNIDEPMAERRSYLDAYMRAFTGQGISAAGAADFLKRMSDRAGDLVGERAGDR
ncbi:MAG: TetR/AcrR family transcriptional regulator [Pseudomonadota bacterium]